MVLQAQRALRVPAVKQALRVLPAQRANWGKQARLAQLVLQAQQVQQALMVLMVLQAQQVQQVHRGLPEPLVPLNQVVTLVLKFPMRRLA